MFFEFDDYELLKAKIKVVGVGGAGGNALNRMIKDTLMGVEFVAVNTDAQDLEENLAEIKIQIGKELTKGLGAGADTDGVHVAAQDAAEPHPGLGPDLDVADDHRCMRDEGVVGDAWKHALVRQDHAAG